MEDTPWLRVDSVLHAMLFMVFQQGKREQYRDTGYGYKHGPLPVGVGRVDGDYFEFD